MFASDKCRQLATSLHAMKMKISSDDVHTAAEYITQAANNLLAVSYLYKLKFDRNECIYLSGCQWTIATTDHNS